MKNIITLLLLTLIVSCTKNERREGYFFFYTNAKDASYGLIQGVRTTCDVIKFKGADKKSLSITMYTGNGYFIQTGYHTFGNSTVPFTGIYLNGQQVGVPTVLINNPVLLFGQRQSFGIYHYGAGKWRTTVDGIDCIELNLGSDFGSSAELYTEVGPAASPGRFPTINFYPAIETMINSSWQFVSSAYVSSGAWGIEGQLQNPSLQSNELNIGSAFQTQSFGTVLWNNN